MRKLYLVLSIVALTLGLASATFAHERANVYRVDLNELNDSGVTGKATLIQQGDDLRVHIVARGLEANILHRQHIHGLEHHENATCPGREADTDSDGLVDLIEGLPFYGPVLLGLEPFPTADARGKITFNESYMIKNMDLQHLEDEVIVLHGMTVDGAYVATLPVACGQIMQRSGGHR